MNRELRIHGDGSRSWRINEEYHREGGPAVEWHDGIKSYYIILHNENILYVGEKK